jgi:poly-gamma-glutamate synthesis protein (capsule biosynthesis protein)
MSDELIVYAVGDIAPDRDEPGTLFKHVSETLNRGDIAFCQLESVLSERGTPLPQARLVCRAKPQVARALKDAGFKIVSFASNHCMDLGREAFYDTLDVLKREGLSVIGAGRNIGAARQPAMVETKGTRVAFLSYNSILPQAYWAEVDRPGCAPMRAFTIYEQVEHDQPGTPCRIHTYPHRGDLNAMMSDIRQAKTQADVVIASFHWGIHFVPAVIADYQRDVAHAAIDAGADLILGHHAHILKGIEVYKGKAIFYSLCNFAIDLAAPKELLERPGHQEIAKLNPDWKPDPAYPTYFMPPDSRKTIVVKCVIANRRIQRIAFLPTYINSQSQPEVLRASDPRFDQVVEYVERITSHQALGAEFTIEGNEVLVRVPSS